MSEDNLALMIKLSLHLVMNQVLNQVGVDRGGLRIQDGTSRVPGGRHQGEAEDGLLSEGECSDQEEKEWSI